MMKLRSLAFSFALAGLALGLASCDDSSSSNSGGSSGTQETRLIGDWKWTMLTTYITFRSDATGAIFVPIADEMDSSAFTWAASNGNVKLTWESDDDVEQALVETGTYRFLSDSVVELKIPSGFSGTAKRVASIPR